MQNSSNATKIFTGFLYLMALIYAIAIGCAAENPVSLKEQMRLLWPDTPEKLSRAWLICGEFPVPRDTNEIDAEALAAGFSNDYLQGHGGEAAIRPVAGWEHRRPDKTFAAWKPYESTNDTVTFSSVLPGRPGDGVAWYAFTSVVRSKAGKAVFSISSRNAVKVWLNGVPVHTHHLDYEAPYTDVLEVPLQAGDNAVLVKVAQQEAGSFTFRILELAQAQMAELSSPRLSPSIIPRDELPNELVVASDQGRNSFLLSRKPVGITVVGVGSKVIAEMTVNRGEQASFDTTDWAEGPYEIRLMTKDGGRIATTYLPWYNGDALEAAKQLVKTAPKPDDRSKEGMVHAMLAELVVDRLGKDWKKVKPTMLPAVYPALMEFAELQQDGAESLPGRHGGLVRLVYRDDCDDSPQFCRVYLPSGFSPRKNYPLIVSLHGRSDTFPPYVKWGGIDQRHDKIADGYGVITMYPHGRGNSWYRGMGDRDVMRCLEMVKERFSVDEDRVYLMGYSMGGAGTWYMGTRHPGQFAALAPFFGGYDYRFQADDDTLAKLTPRERYRKERLSYIAQLEALRTTPVFTSHGDADTIVPVDYSRYTVGLLQRWGYHVRYWEHPGMGHSGLGNDTEVLDWLLTNKRIANPAHVSLRSAELRNAAAHWVKVIQRKNPYAFMTVDAEVLSPSMIRLNTANVLEIELSPSASLVDMTQPLQVVWNDEEVLTVPFTEGKLTLRARGYQPTAQRKRPELEGPVTDLYNTPFAVVVGTISPDPLMRRMCERAAQRYALWWNERFRCKPRVFTDTAITPEEQAAYSLLLIGGPGENAVAKAMSEQIPLTIARNTITIGGRAFPVRQAAVQMIYPNPLNADRYVVIRTATSAPAMALVDYVLNDVDFCIVDSRNIDPQSAGGFFDAVTGRCSGTPIVAGYFDNAWEYHEANIELDKAPRNAALLTAPCYASASATVAVMPLSDLVETRAEGVFLDMARNANLQRQPMILRGKACRSGIAVPPTYWLPKQANGIEYDLTGGNWSRLRATIGLELTETAKDANTTRQATTHIEFVVKGDGVELYHSPPFGRDSKPREIDVDITEVKTLRLEILNKGTDSTRVKSVDWGDIRLER